MKRSRAPRLRGEISIPGDKSISHRAVLLSALAHGRSRIRGLNLGGDVRATIAAVSALGAAPELEEDNARLEIDGFGLWGSREPDDVLDCGNSGTTMRTVLGVVAAVDGLTVVTGDDSLRSRPMGRVAAPLRDMGAAVWARAGDRAPIAVRGGRLDAVEVRLEVASAQVKTAVLVAGLRAAGRTTVVEPAPSRDHTERMMAAAGVPVGGEGLSAWVDGGTGPQPLDLDVPGDVSAAMFFVAGAAVLPGSDVTIRGVGLNPTRIAALEVLADMGAQLEIEVESEAAGEPVGTIRASSGPLRAVRVDPVVVPGLIDEIPALCVAAAFAEGETVITGAEELRVKESDRIAAMAAGLRALGCDARELPDGLAITGPAELSGGIVDSMGDHRIAMAFAIAGLAAAEGVRIRRWGCVDTSFPGFTDALDRARRG